MTERELEGAEEEEGGEEAEEEGQIYRRPWQVATSSDGLVGLEDMRIETLKRKNNHPFLVPKNVDCAAQTETLKRMYSYFHYLDVRLVKQQPTTDIVY